MSDIEIHPIDSVYIKVVCDRGICKELSDFFTFTVPNYKYIPAYRNKMWDGQIRLYNIHTQRIYSGLKEYVLKFAAERNYTVRGPPERDAQKLAHDTLKVALMSSSRKFG